MGTSAVSRRANQTAIRRIGSLDIDLAVRLRAVSDLDFFRRLEPLMASVGRAIPHNLFVESDRYVGSFLVEGYPPFWHVDIACIAEEHVDDHTVLQDVEPIRAFGAWLSAVKRFRRADDPLEHARTLIGAADTKDRYAPRRLFDELLGHWYRRYPDELRHGIGRAVLDNAFPSPPLKA